MTEPPERRTMSAERFEELLHSTLNAVTPPEELAQRLLAVPDEQAPAPLPRSSAKDWPRRLLPVAAVLLLALGIGRYFHLDAALALNTAFLNQVCSTQAAITTRHLPLDDINTYLRAALGAHLSANANTAALDVNFVGDCPLAQRPGTYLLLQGKQGQITVFMLNAALVSAATPITGEHLRGKIIPSGGKHTLAVVGGEQEAIDDYVQMLDANLEWEY
ncbi:MAG: DUF3379 domain-containing protein [Pseudomonadales bacterium]|jgi:hypothetical protein|nr:DUF3379 domain-containing protein [Pseudomonadales bacterium]